MNVEEHYQKIIHEITQGHRALIRFKTEELEAIEKILAASLKTQSNEIEKIFCLIEHSASLYPDFEPYLIEALGLSLPDHQIIFALNCSRRHIIQSRQQRGIRLQFDFLEALKKLLYSTNPEIVEWALRTIEECGSQGIYFLREFGNIKPPPWKWFNKHQRAVIEIITMLERRWRGFEKH